MMKKIYFFTLMFLSTVAAFAQPLVSAPTPTIASGNVLSLYSNAYTNVPIDTWRTSWSAGVTTLSDILIAGNDTKLYNNLDYVGIEFTGANTINATSMQYYHVDVWTPNATTFRIKLVDFGANGTYGGGDDVEHEYVVPTLTLSGWNSYDIPLSAFTGLTTRAHLEQMIFSALPSGGANVYIDNVYFYNTTTPPTQPIAAAPTPTVAAANVISLFSNAYTNVPIDTWRTSWSAATLADVQVAGNDTKLYTNLDYVGIEFTGANTIDATNMLYYHVDVWTPNATTFRIKLVDFGANGTYGGGDDVEHEYVVPTLTQSGWNSYNIPLSAFTGLTTRAHLEQMIFSAAPAGSATVYIDNVYFYNTNTPPTQPIAAAPTPTVAVANVISLFSNAYTNVPIDTWRTSWSAATLADVQVAGNDTKLYTNLDYVGIEFTGANTIDATSMQYYHVDVWTPNATTFRIKLVDFGVNGTYGGGDDVEHEYVVPTLTQSGWNSYNIPLSAFMGLTTRAHLEQMIFSAATAGAATVYIDNVYFWKIPNAPTITNFSIPAQVTGAVPFTITAPTSNSSGAFTYTSSNTSVATISGNIITVVGGGTSIITANQAAAGIYGTGSITAPLVVTFGPPMIAAPLPVALPINVLSLYSDTYTNLAGINWNPNWGQSTTVTDIVIAGNTTRKYDNLNYQGVEFVTTFDVSSFTKLHIDVWTPNCTAFKVFLINIAPAPFVEQSVTLTPTLSGWNSYNIDLATSFRSPASVVDLTKIGQMKFESVPFGGTTVYVDNMYFFRANPVPVKLINFAAKAVKNVTNLTWTTLNELNNKGFSVEKSTDGANFNAIGFVNGVGNASNNNNYATFDKTPATGYNYYRLKQIDLDGNFTYSAIEKVKFDKSDLLGFSFFPNPVKDILKITIGAIDTENAMVSLVNELGQVIVSQKVNKSAFATELDIKVANIASGNYYLRLVDGVTNSIQKVVVNN